MEHKVVQAGPTGCASSWGCGRAARRSPSTLGGRADGLALAVDHPPSGASPCATIGWRQRASCSAASASPRRSARRLRSSVAARVGAEAFDPVRARLVRERERAAHRVRAARDPRVVVERAAEHHVGEVRARGGPAAQAARPPSGSANTRIRASRPLDHHAPAPPTAAPISAPASSEAPCAAASITPPTAAPPAAPEATSWRRFRPQRNQWSIENRSGSRSSTGRSSRSIARCP